jgi:hypothetical protein
MPTSPVVGDPFRLVISRGASCQSPYPGGVRLYLAPHERRPDPEPLLTDDRKAVLVGTGVWVVLLVAAIATRGALAESGRTWWIWTCAAGAGLGLLGLAYLHHREVRQRRESVEATAEEPHVRDAVPPRRGR